MLFMLSEKVLKGQRKGSKKAWTGLKAEKVGKCLCQVQQARLGLATS